MGMISFLIRWKDRIIIRSHEKEYRAILNAARDSCRSLLYVTKEMLETPPSGRPTSVQADGMTCRETYDRICRYNRSFPDDPTFREEEKLFLSVEEEIEAHNRDIRELCSRVTAFRYRDFLQDPIRHTREELEPFRRDYERVAACTEAEPEIRTFQKAFGVVFREYETIQAQYRQKGRAEAWIRTVETEDSGYYDDEAVAALRQKYARLVQVFTQSAHAFYPYPPEERLTEAVERHNEAYMQSRMHDPLFDDVNGKSLDEDQRRAILCEDRTSLVLASAGSGKTLTICGRIKYLTERMGVDPSEILLLSYSKESARDLTEKTARVTDGLRAGTFHALGLDIVSRTYGRRFVVEDQFEAIVEDYFRTEEKNPEQLSRMIRYFALYPYAVDPHEKKHRTVGDLYQDLKRKDYRTWKNALMALSDAPDGKRTVARERVKSYEELVIANFLFINGIDYEYERPYPYRTETKERRQYCPDFYLPDYDLYIEHYGIDRNGYPTQFEEEEARRYTEGIRFKRETHAAHHTTCLETYSYWFREGTIFRNLEQLLKAHGVVFRPIPKEELEERLEAVMAGKSFRSFRSLVLSFLSLYKARYRDERFFEELKQAPFDTVYNRQRAEVFLDICRDIYLYYRRRLHYTTQHPDGTVSDECKMDFDDMILQATDCLNQDMTDDYRYRYIIVDEFQDISYSRMRFLQALIRHGQARLFAVGDDWQSIYRFAGCDLNIFLHSERYFAGVHRHTITSTHRNSAELIAVAEPFITANEGQIRKNISSALHTEHPLQLLYYSDQKREAFHHLLKKIYVKNPSASVMVLGRNNHDLESVLYPDCVRCTRQNKGMRLTFERMETLSVCFRTVHASKGLEADYVILINAEDDPLGFPNRMEDDPILSLVLSGGSAYPFAEERRLFYVALTRTKQVCYILVNRRKPSPFIREIAPHCLSLNSPSDTDNEPVIHCPECKSGRLVLKNGQNGPFYGCSHYPYCRYTGTHIADIRRNLRCPVCGNFLILRRSRQSGEAFLGCASYPDCTYTKPYAGDPSDPDCTASS